MHYFIFILLIFNVSCINCSEPYLQRPPTIASNSQNCTDSEIYVKSRSRPGCYPKGKV